MGNFLFYFIFHTFLYILTSYNILFLELEKYNFFFQIVVQDKENKKNWSLVSRTKIILKVKKCKKIKQTLPIIKKQITSQVTLYHRHYILICIKMLWIC